MKTVAELRSGKFGEHEDYWKNYGCPNMVTERRQLEWLGKQHNPVWGGHLQRSEPISDPDMQRWLQNGWIEVTPCKTGYRLTPQGREALDTLRK